jgi:hypothetical protein
MGTAATGRKVSNILSYERVSRCMISLWSGEPNRKNYRK